MQVVPDRQGSRNSTLVKMELTFGSSHFAGQSSSLVGEQISGKEEKPTTHSSA